MAGRRLTISGDERSRSIQPAFASVEPLELEQWCRFAENCEAPDPAGMPAWRDLAAGIYRGPDGALVAVQRDPSSVQYFLAGTPHRLELIASPAALESGDLRAHPASYAIASWIASPTLRMVHAGAVALGGRGVLFVGVGGRGKTTTALACARDGFSFMADDLCIVEAATRQPVRPPLVHGMFATAKLNADSRMRLDARNWTELGTTPKGKTAVKDSGRDRLRAISPVGRDRIRPCGTGPADRNAAHRSAGRIPDVDNGGDAGHRGLGRARAVAFNGSGSRQRGTGV